MSDVNWNALMAYPNAGQSFASAFQAGQEQNRQRALEQRQMQQQDQARAFQMQRMQSDDAMKALDAHRENILKGAQLIRQFQPKDDAGWQQLLMVAQQAGIDTSEVPPHYDPQYIEGVVHLADTFAPEKTQGTALQQNYDFLSGKDPKLADSYLHNQAEGPPLIASNGDGTFTIIPRNVAGGGASPPPPPPGFQLDDGGPTPPASGNFPQ